MTYKGWVIDIIKAACLSISGGEKPKRSYTLFSFDKMITPKIISVMYVLTIISTVIVILFCLSIDKVAGAIVAVIGLFFSRVFFEFVIVTFKNNEYLARIALALDAGKHETERGGINESDSRKFNLEDEIRKEKDAWGRSAEKKEPDADFESPQKQDPQDNK